MLKVKGIEDLRKFVNRLEKTDKVLGAIDSAFYNALDDNVADKARNIVARDHKKTGTMLRSIYTEVDKSFGNVFMPLENEGGLIGFDYFEYVHDGSPAHEIPIGEVGVLSDYNSPFADGFFSATKVNHPGYEGDPFLETALDLGINGFVKDFEEDVFKQLNTVY
jgi:hypothetical protein